MQVPLSRGEIDFFASIIAEGVTTSATGQRAHWWDESHGTAYRAHEVFG